MMNPGIKRKKEHVEEWKELKGSMKQQQKEHPKLREAFVRNHLYALRQVWKRVFLTELLFYEPIFL